MRLFRKKIAVRRAEAPLKPWRSGFAPAQVFRCLALLGLAGGVLLASGMRPAEANTANSKTTKAQPAASGKTETGFHAYLESIWPHARAAGVTRATFDAALNGVTLDQRVLKPMSSQAEFVKPIWSYINGAVTTQRIEKGREMARTYQSVLMDIEARFGVDRHVVLAIWGMETSYGGYTGKSSVIRALASHAYAGPREEFFRTELIGAMLILQQGHARPETLIGSWAGAMGQTQFMPTSFLKHAVDYDGDGRKNIWTGVPDALASTANYLAHFGWQRGQPWGFEVVLPAGFDITGHDPLEYRPFSYWVSKGLRRPTGASMPASGTAAIMLPAGRNGPVFLLTQNFRVIKEYNRSNAYAFGVGHLGERIAGAGPIRGAWPTSEKPLSTAQAKELQRNLARLGYNVGKIDGKFGDQVTAAVRAYQKNSGQVADGYPSHAVLQQVRNAR
jgi:lytic murein transglycosylase